MPEGPELHFASNFVNDVCKNRVFGGNPVKSDVSKNPEINWPCNNYVISSKSRGKEVMLTLMNKTKGSKAIPPVLKILFHFGMSGNFQLTTVDSLPKHAHLRFYTIKEDPQMVLSFVDFRRFGSWAVTDNWGADRGPDPVLEYDLFRQNVLSNLEDNVFKKSICETMLNQKYFNGIGNYLRAEILYRAGIKPFEESLTVLEKISNEDQKIKKENPDLLQLCRDVMMEAINLKVSPYIPGGDNEQFQPFMNWLQCYDKEGMYNTRDRNKRTIWFNGNDPGPLAPKNAKVSKKVSKSSPKKENSKSPVKKLKTEVKNEEITKKTKKPKTEVKEESPSKETKVIATRRSTRNK